MNKVCVTGRLCADPIYQTSASGTTYAKFRLAIQRAYKRDTADFIDCTAWGKTAEFVDRFFYKGKEIGVTGSIQSDTYTANDGTKRYNVYINVESAEFVGSKSDSPAREETPRTEVKPDEYTIVEDDEDLPF